MIIIVMRKKKVDSFRLELKRKTTNDWNEWKDLKKKSVYDGSITIVFPNRTAKV